MKNIKERLSNFLTFSKKEIEGLAVLFLLLGGVLLFPTVQRYFSPTEKVVEQSEQIYLDSIADVLLVQSLSESANKINPNLLSYYQWLDLGVSNQLANAILKEKKRRKKFHCLKELKAVKGVKSSVLANYFEDFSFVSDCSQEVKEVIVSTKITVKTKGERFELNSVSVKQLAGFVSLTKAKGIIGYRAKLGGFYSVHQLKEVPGVKEKEFDLLKENVKVNPTKIKFLKINLLSKAELRKHPYLTEKQASTLVNFRKKIGRYEGLAQFKKVYGLSANERKRLQPYLLFD